MKSPKKFKSSPTGWPTSAVQADSEDGASHECLLKLWRGSHCALTESSRTRMAKGDGQNLKEEVTVFVGKSRGKIYSLWASGVFRTSVLHFSIVSTSVSSHMTSGHGCASNRTFIDLLPLPLEVCSNSLSSHLLPTEISTN